MPGGEGVTPSHPHRGRDGFAPGVCRYKDLACRSRGLACRGEGGPGDQHPGLSDPLIPGCADRELCSLPRRSAKAQLLSDNLRGRPKMKSSQENKHRPRDGSSMDRDLVRQSKGDLDGAWGRNVRLALSLGGHAALGQLPRGGGARPTTAIGIPMHDQHQTVFLE